MSDNPVHRMYDALAKGDIPAMKACFTPAARIWHCFDGITQNLDEAAKGWEALLGFTKARGLENIRSVETGDGFLQRHVFVMQLANDDRKAWHVCLVVKTDGNLISDFEEYIDRAGGFTPA